MDLETVVDQGFQALEANDAVAFNLAASILMGEMGWTKHDAISFFLNGIGGTMFKFVVDKDAED